MNSIGLKKWLVYLLVVVVALLVNIASLLVLFWFWIANYTNPNLSLRDNTVKMALTADAKTSDTPIRWDYKKTYLVRPGEVVEVVMLAGYECFREVSAGCIFTLDAPPRNTPPEKVRYASNSVGDRSSRYVPDRKIYYDSPNGGQVGNGEDPNALYTHFTGQRYLDRMYYQTLPGSSEPITVTVYGRLRH